MSAPLRGPPTGGRSSSPISPIPTAPKITTGESATVVNGSDQNAIMRLRDGTEHETVANQPDQYNVSTFAQTDLPLSLTAPEDTRPTRSDSPILAMSNRELIERSHGKGGRWYLIELHKRFAYPAACLVLMLVGVPLGLSSKRGGKGAGFVLTIALVFVYYFLSSTGTALARQHKLPVAVGIWLANVLFAACGVFLLRQMSTGGAALAAIASIGGWFKAAAKSDTDETPEAQSVYRSAKPRHTRGRFPLILDEYVLSQFLGTFAMVLVSFVMLMLIFTCFELLGDIIRNRTSFITVAAYLANLTPSMIYTITPLAVLIAVLVVFGLMSKSSELTAMKASGISLYRIVLPVFIIASLLAAALFAFDQVYLPQANRRQEALRNVIKGKPPQTFEHPGPEVALRPAGARQARPHLLLRALRSGTERLRQPHRLRVQSRDLLHLAPHLRLQRALGAAAPRMGLRAWMGAHLQRRRDQQLPTLRREHLPRNPRAAAVLQERELCSRPR